ncbi:MAG: TIGR01777 family oxidoreductase [Verrucomicrobiota bacterium]
MKPKRRIAIAGVTGFIGRGLPALFAAAGWECTGISRNRAANHPHVTSWQTPEGLALAGHDAVVNLAGEPIAKRWTKKNFPKFRESRVGFTNHLVGSIARLPEHERPRVLVNGSAVGIYGDRGDVPLEEDAARGTGPLADLCDEWENAALAAVPLGLRVVLPRIGIVLGNDGGAYHSLATVFRLGLGGRLGDGTQWMSWIHLEDMRALILHSVLNPALAGPLNACAPTPVRNAEFTRTLSASLHRPAFFHVPAPVLKWTLGGFGGALLESQRAVPRALADAGFRFRFAELATALHDLAGSRRKSFQ